MSDEDAKREEFYERLNALVHTLEAKGEKCDVLIMLHRVDKQLGIPIPYQLRVREFGPNQDKGWREVW